MPLTDNSVREAYVTPLQVWHLATSIRLMFDGKLDAVKYHFRMPSLTEKAFAVRKDRYFFEKLARRHPKYFECIWFIAANVMADSKWIGSMTEEPYTELQAWHESANYRLKEEFKALVTGGVRWNSFDELLKAGVDGTPPPILVAFSNNAISIHSIMILQAITGFLNYEMTKVQDPLSMWESHATRIQTYAKIFSYVHRVEGASFFKPFHRIVKEVFTSQE